MAVELGKEIQYYRNEGMLDHIIHYFIVNGSIEWDDSYLERANVILGEHKWRMQGEFVPIDANGQISEITLVASTSIDLIDCEFVKVQDDYLPGVVLAVDMETGGQGILFDFESLHTTDGIPFEALDVRQMRKRKNMDGVENVHSRQL